MERNQSLMRNDTPAEMIMSKAENIYNIADNHARTVQVCIDRLHELGANEQLKMLTERLQKLAVRPHSRRRLSASSAAHANRSCRRGDRM